MLDIKRRDLHTIELELRQRADAIAQLIRKRNDAAPWWEVKQSLIEGPLAASLDIGELPTAPVEERPAPVTALVPNDRITVMRPDKPRETITMAESPNAVVMQRRAR